MVFIFRINPYTRPYEYFILLGILSTIVFAQIFTIQDNRMFKILLFFEILLIPTLFTLTQQLLYKTVLSRDPWLHWALTKGILLSGGVYEIVPSPYVKMPNFHILIAIGSALSGLNYKWASFYIAGMGTLVLNMVVIYLISVRLFNERHGFLSMLIIGITDNILDMNGKNIVPNTVGITIIFLLLYLFLRHEFNNDKKINIIIITLVVGLVLMHTISYIFLLVQILILIIIKLFYEGYNKKIKIYIIWSIIMVILSVIEWAYISEVYFSSLVTLMNRILTYGIQPEKYFLDLTIPFWKVLMSRIGMIFFLGFAGINIIFIILKQREDKLKIILSIITGFFIGSSFSFITPILSGISHRFWYYSEVLGSIIVASYLDLSWESQKGIFKKSVDFIFIFVITILMLTASVSNDDNPLISEYTLRTGWFDSEISTVLFIKGTEVPIASDYDFASNINHFIISKENGVNSTIDVVNPQSFDEILTENMGRYAFILRKNMTQNRYFFLGGRWSQNPHAPLEDELTLIIDKFSYVKSIIYSNNNVIIYH